MLGSGVHVTCTALEHCLDGTTTFLYQAPVRSTQAANVIVILDDSSGMAMLGGWPFYNLVNMEDALLHRGKFVTLPQSRSTGTPLMSI